MPILTLSLLLNGSIFVELLLDTMALTIISHPMMVYHTRLVEHHLLALPAISTGVTDAFQSIIGCKSPLESHILAVYLLAKGIVAILLNAEVNTSAISFDNLLYLYSYV